MARILALLMVVVLAVIAVTLVLYQEFQESTLNLPTEEYSYTVPAGASLNQLAYDLQENKIIEHPRFFILLGRQMDAARQLQAGEYKLIQGLTPRSLLEQFVDAGTLADDFWKGLLDSFFTL